MRLKNCVWYLLVITSLWNYKLSAQNADFSVPTNVCIDELVSIVDNSVSDSLFWDFCVGDLNETPIVSDLITISDGSTTIGIDVVSDGEYWYGFVTSRANNLLFRVDFGTDLYNSSDLEIVNLGNPDDVLNLPQKINIINDSTNWYGFVANGGSESLVRIDFGTDLGNLLPSGEVVATGSGDVFNGFDIIFDDTKWVISLGHLKDLLIIDLGDKLSNIPAAEDISTLSVTGSNLITDIEIKKYNSEWHGYVTSWNSKTLHHILFGTTITNAGTITEIDPGFFGANRPTSIYIGGDSTIFQGIISTLSGDIYRLSFNSGLNTSPQIEDLGDYGVLANTYAIDIEKYQSTWYGFTINGSTKAIQKVEFHKNCANTLEYSVEEIPLNLTYSESGIRQVEQRAYANLNIDSSIEELTVSANVAPLISFTASINECVTQSNTFTPSTDAIDPNYQWEVDEVIEQNGANAAFTHALGDTDPHQIKLTIDDGTCTNNLIDSITLYPDPITPTFFTSGAPYCSGADISFTNLFDESDYNGATLTYSWDYDGEGTSSERNGLFNFDTEGSKTVTLTAAIPGCSMSSTEDDINLIEGPLVNFTFEDKCLGDQTQFTNLTTGDNLDDQTWDFGDGNMSSQTSPSNEYQDFGDFDVSLNVENSSGCSNTLILPITIDDKPVADFNMGVGCEGVLVGFEDLTTVENANIDSYLWDFGGEGQSTDQDPSFTFETQGSYDVTLSVESTFGCSDEVTKNLNVQLAPAADFAINLGCLDASTLFTDQTETESENPISQWFWTIDDKFEDDDQNLDKVFDTAGQYTATLRVTPSNLCASTISKDFTIHELPIANFSSINKCDNEQAVFEDASSSTTTSIESFYWDFSDQGSSNLNPALFNFSEPGDYKVKLTVTDDIGCEDTKQKTITINASPIAEFRVSSDIGPAPLVIDFTNKSEDATSYLWLFNDEQSSTSAETNPQFSYTENGDYSTELISSNDMGCSDTTSTLITVATPVLDLELLQITSEENEGKINLTLSIKNSGNVTLHGFDVRIDMENISSVFESYDAPLLRSETISIPLNLTFSANDGNISYTCITLIDRESNHEDVNLLNNEGCISFEEELVIEDIYPNPSSGASSVQLNIILPTKAPVQLFLLDPSGAVLYEETYMDANQGFNSFLLDIYSFQQGMYFIKVIYSGVETTQRFVKI